MSYELSFWAYKKGVRTDDESVYHRLSDGSHVDSVEFLPIDLFLARIKEEFRDWRQLDDVTFDNECRGGFQLFTTTQFLCVVCYEMSGEEMNKFIDIAQEFGCPLYDPQVGRRFANQS